MKRTWTALYSTYLCTKFHPAKPEKESESAAREGQRNGTSEASQ